MNKMKALGPTIAVLALATFPALGAIFQLGVALTKIDRMHHSRDVAARLVAR
jgi:hypothetical protein